MQGNTQAGYNNRVRIISQRAVNHQNHQNHQNNLGDFDQSVLHSQSPTRKKIKIYEICNPITIQFKSEQKNREKRSISEQLPEITYHPQIRQFRQNTNNNFTKGTDQPQAKFKIPDQQQNPGIQKKQKEKFNHYPLVQQQTSQQSDQSRPQTVEISCFYCKIYQRSDFIILPCSHQFHAECLKLLMDNQVNQQSAIIRCQCGKKIPQQFCVQYLSPFQLKIYFQIQAQLLPKLNQERRKWKKCTNHGCDYIFIEDPRLNINVKKSKCPNCIEQIQGKTMLFPKSKYL